MRNQGSHTLLSCTVLAKLDSQMEDRCSDSQLGSNSNFMAFGLQEKIIRSVAVDLVNLLIMQFLLAEHFHPQCTFLF